MNYKLILVLLLTVVALIGLPMAAAQSSYLTSFNQYYNTAGTKLDSCNTCHTSSGGTLNSYGRAYLVSGRNFASIESLDSDKDGFTNLQEIKALTFPGDPNDYPPTTSATPTVTSANVTPGQQTAEVTVNNTTQEKPTPQVTVNNTTQEKPIPQVAANNTTEAPKSPGFEAILAVVGLLSIVYLNKKYVQK